MHSPGMNELYTCNNISLTCLILVLCKLGTSKYGELTNTCLVGNWFPYYHLPVVTDNQCFTFSHCF